MSRTEAYVLANLVILGEPQLVFEIGTGFGYSSTWLAIGLAAVGSGKLVTLDEYSEGGLGATGLHAAEALLDAAGLRSLVELRVGSSPEYVPTALNGRSIDVAFIDANHHGDSPKNDYASVVPWLTESSLIAFHDVDDTRYSVSSAVDQAVADGWHIEKLQTSCYLTLGYRDQKWPDLIAEAYRDARRACFSARRR